MRWLPPDQIGTRQPADTARIEYQILNNEPQNYEGLTSAFDIPCSAFCGFRPFGAYLTPRLKASLPAADFFSRSPMGTRKCSHGSWPRVIRGKQLDLFSELAKYLKLLTLNFSVDKFKQRFPNVKTPVMNFSNSLTTGFEKRNFLFQSHPGGMKNLELNRNHFSGL